MRCTSPKATSPSFSTPTTCRAAGLLKQLVAPFFDPEVGAVMGRVVPVNSGANLLTRLLDLERSGGYQVDQQARMNMNLMPQYGGTVGGVRLSARGGRRRLA